MPPRLAAKNTTAAETKVLDEMSDGQWHPITKITKNCAEKKVLSSAQVKDTVNELTERGYILSGANNSFRLPEKYVRQWRNSRGLSMDTVDSHSPRFFGGMIEDDGWAHAPLTERQLLSFRANSHITSQVIREKIGDMGEVNQAEDGLFRIISTQGDELYDLLKEWNRFEPEVKIEGLRLTYGTFRRNIQDLPPAYLADFCEFYGSFSYVLLRNNMSSVVKHIPENDDTQQQIYLWVLDAIVRYDDKTCIPFAAYLSTCLLRWVHNLNRKPFGRAAADNELKHFRANSQFEAENGRKPSLHELAGILEENVEKVIKDSLSIKMVSNLRSATTLDSEEFNVPLIAVETADKGVEAYLERTLISAALISSALDQDIETKGASLVALMSVIDKTWNKDKRLAKIYKSKRSSDLLQQETKLLALVGDKIGDLR